MTPARTPADTPSVGNFGDPRINMTSALSRTELDDSCIDSRVARSRRGKGTRTRSIAARHRKVNVASEAGGLAASRARAGTE